MTVSSVPSVKRRIETADLYDTSSSKFEPKQKSARREETEAVVSRAEFSRLETMFEGVLAGNRALTGRVLELERDSVQSQADRVELEGKLLKFISELRLKAEVNGLLISYGTKSIRKTFYLQDRSTEEKTHLIDQIRKTPFFILGIGKFADDAVTSGDDRFIQFLFTHCPELRFKISSSIAEKGRNVNINNATLQLVFPNKQATRLNIRFSTSTSSYTVSLIELAIRNSNKNFICFLEKSGFLDASYVESGNNILHLAARNLSNIEFFTFLHVKFGLNLNQKNGNGNTPLHLIALSYLNNSLSPMSEYNYLLEFLEKNPLVNTQIKNDEGKMPEDIFKLCKTSSKYFTEVLKRAKERREAFQRRAQQQEAAAQAQREAAAQAQREAAAINRVRTLNDCFIELERIAKEPIPKDQKIAKMIPFFNKYLENQRSVPIIHQSISQLLRPLASDAAVNFILVRFHPDKVRAHPNQRLVDDESAKKITQILYSLRS
jgi:flagellar biosynthesis/type III secretory pathway protein FliH